MTVLIIGLNATTTTGSNITIVNGSSLHGVLSDVGTTAFSYAHRTGVLAATQSVLEFAPATGVIPSNAYIKQVRLVAYAGAPVESGGLYLKSGATSEFELNMHLGPTPLTQTPGWGYGPWRTTAPGGAAWTLALIDALQFVVNWPANVTSSADASLYSAYIQVEYYRPPLQPTGVTPAVGSINTDGNPTLAATLVSAGDGATQNGEWQIASNNTFTSNLKTVTQDSTKLILSGYTTQKPSPNLQLAQGTWYVRARGKDQYGNYGPYSTTNSFSVSHPASSKNLVPESNTVKLYTTNTIFSWTFSDPLLTDSQSAYQLVVTIVDTGVVIYDSGKVSSGVSSVAVPLGAGNKDKQLKWKLALWDQSDATAGYSQEQSFRVSDAPTVTITSPANTSTIDTGQPTITWTVDGATTQYQRRIVIRRVSDDAVVLSTYVTTTSQTYTPPGTILSNNTDYTVAVTVYDTDGLTGIDTNAFSTEYEAPDDVTYTVDAGSWDDNGYVDIDWTTVADGFFIDWRVYRRLYGTLEWSLIAVYTNQAIKTHHDWEAGNGNYYQYAVTQTAGRFGEVLESAKDPAAETYFTDGTHYWLINPVDESQNLRLDNVTADDFTNGYERESMTIIGRGRKVNLGTRLGYAGTLTAQFRDNVFGTARSKRLALELIQSSLSVFFLRNPFGDVFEVSLGDLSFTRISGVGISEFVDVTIPYEEVM